MSIGGGRIPLRPEGRSLLRQRFMIDIDDGHVEIKVKLDKRQHVRFKHKCNFYDVTYAEVFNLAVEKFIDGEYDKELNIPSN